jgi:Tfp pilus assembly protein PilF
MLARIARQQEDPDRSLGYLTQAVEIDPTQVNARVQAAKLHLGKEQAGPAEQTLRDALMYNPQSVEAAVLLTGILARTGREEEAFALLENMLIRVPDAGVLYQARARLLVQQQRPAEAIADLQKAVDLAPDHTRAVVQLAGLLTDQGRASEAVTLLQAFVKENPDKKRARLMLARLLLEEKAYEQARSLLHDLTGNRAFSEPAHLLLGEIFWRNGHPDLAYEEYRAALLKGSKLLAAHPELAVIHTVKTDVTATVTEFKKILEEKGISPMAWSMARATGE